MGDSDLYSTDFTYGIIILAVVLHLSIMAIVIYLIFRHNRCQCCVVHRHDNNITTVVVSRGETGSQATDSQILIPGQTHRPGISRQTSFLARVRTRMSDTVSLPPPYDETSDTAHGEANEGFDITVDLPTYEEYAKDNPPMYEEARSSPPKYDEVVRPSE